jgi:hypothetical protein
VLRRLSEDRDETRTDADRFWTGIHDKDGQVTDESSFRHRASITPSSWPVATSSFLTMTVGPDSQEFGDRPHRARRGPPSLASAWLVR